METQRILMRSLAVVFIASVIWTITDAEEKVKSPCCTEVSSAKFTDPIIGFKQQNESLPCLKAVIFETERGEFCYDWTQPWVKKKVMQFIKAQRNSRTSTPPPASSISEHTHVRGSTQSTQSS